MASFILKIFVTTEMSNWFNSRNDSLILLAIERVEIFRKKYSKDFSLEIDNELYVDKEAFTGCAKLTIDGEMPFQPVCFSMTTGNRPVPRSYSKTLPR